jgi:hypothetical protein
VLADARNTLLKLAANAPISSNILAPAASEGYAIKGLKAAKARPNMKCWKCATEIDTRERVEFRVACPSCDWALHVCKNCQHYDPGYYNQCRETAAERVVDKEKANFCDFFAPGTGAASPRGETSTARARLETLFKKKPR